MNNLLFNQNLCGSVSATYNIYTGGEGIAFHADTFECEVFGWSVGGILDNDIVHAGLSFVVHHFNAGDFQLACRFGRIAKADGPAAPSGQGGREGLFGPAKRSSIGTPYLYFSEEPLTEEQRFTLALKWPPRDMIFLRFTPERVAHVQSSSQKYVEHYNTGDLTF